MSYFSELSPLRLVMHCSREDKIIGKKMGSSFFGQGNKIFFITRSKPVPNTSCPVTFYYSETEKILFSSSSHPPRKYRNTSVNRNKNSVKFTNFSGILHIKNSDRHLSLSVNGVLILYLMKDRGNLCSLASKLCFSNNTYASVNKNAAQAPCVTKALCNVFPE